MKKKDKNTKMRHLNTYRKPYKYIEEEAPNRKPTN